MTGVASATGASALQASGVRSRDRRAIARALSIVEHGGAAAARLLESLAASGEIRSYRVGITGAPGAGKSTLTMQLVRCLRAAGASVAVIAVDPSSPLSGGALLGDRVRMTDVAGDEGVFVRSMATRGSIGGLSAAVADAADVFDAAGFDYLLVETVGVGQNEFDVVQIVDTTLVLITPESGDEVQMAKAGLMEIADVFVLNKDDRPGADAIHSALTGMLDGRRQSKAANAWAASIVRTVAHDGGGVQRTRGCGASPPGFPGAEPDSSDTAQGACAAQSDAAGAGIARS